MVFLVHTTSTTESQIRNNSDLDFTTESQIRNNSDLDFDCTQFMKKKERERQWLIP